MDTARRWQVVSVATAIAGLGVGSLLVGRTASTPIEPIDLDLVVASTEPDRPIRDRPLSGMEIVPPLIREDQVEVPAPRTPTGRAAVDSPEVAPLESPTASLASPAAPPPAPAPTAPVDRDDSLDSDDGDDGVDSVDSVDSDD
ncbi:MAG: hypothetical protein ACNA8R_08010 [Nitriliruptoraceae bacterium]